MLARKKKISQLRLRIFAGPNGSGKSTVIKVVKSTLVNGRPIDFGYYINADDIAVALSDNNYSFQEFPIAVTKKKIVAFAVTSGLLSNVFDTSMLTASFSLNKKKVRLLQPQHRERLAQIFARYLRQALLDARKRFSFETVFSHPSNLDIMKQASAQGYKIYLYFVSTASPEINKYRVVLRVQQNGHSVPEDKIESRYGRSLLLMKTAAQLAYQAYFFDNSRDDEPLELIAHFKKVGDLKKWDRIPTKKVSPWFKKYYGKKD